MSLMTLRGASEYLGISKNRIWRAVKDGQLPSEDGKHKGQKALMVSLLHLEEWAKTALDPTELNTGVQPEVPQKHFETPVRHLEELHEHLKAPRERLEVPQGYSEAPQGVFEVSQGASSRFEAESSLREDLVGALERSQRELRLVERRAIELELALRQSQRLLTENSESITEKEALAKEARAKLEELEQTQQSELERLASELAASQENEAKLRQAEETRRAETEKLTAELESTRLQLEEAQKPSGFFSWLGLRKKRTSPSQSTKVS